MVPVRLDRTIVIILFLLACIAVVAVALVGIPLELVITAILALLIGLALIVALVARIHIGFVITTIVVLLSLTGLSIIASPHVGFRPEPVIILFLLVGLLAIVLRWVAPRFEPLIALLLIVGLAAVFASWTGALLVLLTSILTFAISAIPLRDFYEQSATQTIFEHLKLTLGLTLGLEIVEDGMIVVPGGKSLVWGPRLVIVKPDNAVILECGPYQTEISGPRVFISRPFEYIRGIIDLRDGQNKLTLADVLTSDLMKTTVEYTIGYGLCISSETRRGARGFSIMEKELIRDLDSRLPNWHAAVLGISVKSLRHAVISRTLKDLLKPGTLSVIESDVLAQMTEHPELLGVEITQFSIERVVPDPKEQEQANAAEKLALMSYVAAEFAHRMNNLVGSIPVRIAMAKEKLDPNNPSDARVIKQLDTINIGTKLLLDAAQEIKRTTESRASESVDVNAELDIALGRVWSSKPEVEGRIRVNKGIAADLPRIMAERSKLLDTLVSIIQNGVEAMPEGGTLALATRLGSIEDLPCIEIAISDTGTGIPAADLPKIFDLFFTTKEKGLGFGLWRDRTFVKNLGGDIEVYSTVGEGTTFTIKIPVSSDTSPLTERDLSLSVESN